MKKNTCGSITGLKFWDLELVVVVVFRVVLLSTICVLMYEELKSAQWFYCAFHVILCYVQICWVDCWRFAVECLMLIFSPYLINDTHCVIFTLTLCKNGLSVCIMINIFRTMTGKANVNTANLRHLYLPLRNLVT